MKVSLSGKIVSLVVIISWQSLVRKDGEGKNSDGMITTIFWADWIFYNAKKIKATQRHKRMNYTALSEKKRDYHAVFFRANKMKTPGDSFVYEIQLYTSSFMTSAAWLHYHLHFAQVCLIAGRKSVSKQHFWCFSKYSFFELGIKMRRERKNDRERKSTCVRSSSTDAFLWIILKSASDRLIGSGEWRKETVPFVSGCVSFSITFMSPHLPLMRSPVSD